MWRQLRRHPLHPEGETAVLGLVSNNGQEVETTDYVRQRLEDACRFFPMDQLALCPRCGMRSLSADVQWAKLDVIRAVADETWRP